MPTLRAIAHLPAGHDRGVPFDLVTLGHDERRLRRRLLTLVHGDEVLVDLPAVVTLEDRGGLLLEDGRVVEVIAAEETLYEVRARDEIHLMQLCWHLGNRHLKTQIEREWNGLGYRILILRDSVVRDMLLGLGATVDEVTEPFHPLQGAYGHSHGEPAHVMLHR